MILSDLTDFLTGFLYCIGCVLSRFGLLCALAYYTQHNCDFIMIFNMRFGLLRAFG